jgi:hypothetical protein
MDIDKDVLQPQMKDIFNLNSARDCFELKLQLIRNGYVEKNEYERNEVDIERIKCEIAILRIKKQIKMKLKELKDTLILFEFAQPDEDERED